MRAGYIRQLHIVIQDMDGDRRPQAQKHWRCVRILVSGGKGFVHSVGCATNRKIEYSDGKLLLIEGPPCGDFPIERVEKVAAVGIVEG
jgi:hypothetical protein